MSDEIKKPEVQDAPIRVVPEATIATKPEEPRYTKEELDAMAKRKTITEEMGVHKEWYEQAKKLKPEEVPAFIKHLSEDYDHDYGTICHAIAAGAIATAWAIDRGPNGGITGFQAGAVMWEFIQNWMIEYKDKPLRLVNYEDLLYPQYDEKFDKTISKSTWEWLQADAAKKLKETECASATVRAHWESIVAGNVPFGYKVAL